VNGRVTNADGPCALGVPVAELLDLNPQAGHFELALLVRRNEQGDEDTPGNRQGPHSSLQVEDALPEVVDLGTIGPFNGPRPAGRRAPPRLLAL
jgi:hypothetical protein